MKAALVVKVNGLIIRRVKIREYISGGRPTGEQELIIYDPLVGSFAVDDTFSFEVKDLMLPEAEREALPNDGWLAVTLPELLRQLSAADPERHSRVENPQPLKERPPEPDSGAGQ